ncbi:MAG: hypothetical protein V8T45_01380 [Oscillospiraceae bacterium]
MEIKIMSQQEAQDWSYDQWMGVALLISILGTNTELPTFYNNPRIIEKISLAFDDIQRTLRIIIRYYQRSSVYKFKILY